MGRFSNDELTVELTRALETLPEHYREMILLRDFHGWTIAEIAEQLGVTTAAAKSRLYRAREAIRALLLA